MSCDEDSNYFWNYDTPSEWSKYFPCANGLCQSPINIKTKDSIPEMYSPLFFSPAYKSNQLFSLTNRGQQVTAELVNDTNELTHDDLLWFTGGGLTGKFHFVNFHLHWGPNNRHGSEHEINGHRYPAEAHFVHQNPDNQQIAVLAVLLTLNDEDEDHQWKTYANLASRLTKIHDTKHCTFNLSELLPSDNEDFFRYTGSLTTPPCTEGVLWTIFTRVLSIDERSLDLLRRNLMKTMYRPVQAINGRTIFRNYQYSKTI